MYINNACNFKLYTQDGKEVAIGTTDFKADISSSSEEKMKYVSFNHSKEATLTCSNFQFNQYMMYQMMGYKFIESLAMVDKIQRRKHKSKRINKKWAKRYGYKEVPKKDIYMMDRNIIAHPIIMDLIKKELNRLK